MHSLGGALLSKGKFLHFLFIQFMLLAVRIC